MATAPTSIKAYVIPTNGADPYFEDLPTIETPIPESTYPDGLKPENQKLLEEFKNEAADSHLIYNLPEGAQRGIRQGVYEGRYQPDVRLLPDACRYWGVEDWSKRAVIDLYGHHLLY